MSVESTNALIFVSAGPYWAASVSDVGTGGVVLGSGKLETTKYPCGGIMAVLSKVKGTYGVVYGLSGVHALGVLLSGRSTTFSFGGRRSLAWSVWFCQSTPVTPLSVV